MLIFKLFALDIQMFYKCFTKMIVSNMILLIVNFLFYSILLIFFIR